MPRVVDWGRREYSDALDAMRAAVRDRRVGTIDDTLFLVEHPPVITVGVEGDDGGAADSGLPVVRVERGGQGTYHGPGQIVGYPVVDLEARGRDVRRFVHDVEALLIDALGTFGIPAQHVSGRHGVWAEGARKIASIGIAVDHWVTFHGFALNVDLDLAPFARFRPCGLDGTLMTSMARELRRPVEIGEVRPALVAAWSARFDATAGPTAPRAPEPTAA
jgi:lipoyl(octanoyl) transferase